MLPGGEKLELAGTIAVPIGVLIALLLSSVSWVRQDKTTTLIKKVSEGQQRCESCLTIVATESTKQTTLLEQIAQTIRR